MEYDFFDKNDEEKEPQRIPAPAQFEKKPKKRRVRWYQVVTAIALAIILFFGGWFVGSLTLDEEIRTLLSVKKKVQNEYYKEVTDEEFYAALFDGLNDNLLDNYSEYMTPEEYAATIKDLEGERIGVGLVFSVEGEPLRVSRVCGNSPAEGAGMKAGDKILGCGKTQDSITPITSFEEFSSFLAGYQENEKFFLQIENEGTRLVELYKAKYEETLVFYYSKTTAYSFSTPSSPTAVNEFLSYLPEDAALVRLVEFTGNAREEFAAAMKVFKAEGKQRLVLDLRGNGGGLLDTMQSISKYFCKTATEKYPIVAIADYGEKKVGYKADGNVYGDYFGTNGKVYVLADNGSASASECLLGCMLDYEAIAYGDICLIERGGVAKTYGKGIMQETFPVDYLKGDAIKLTTAEIKWPKTENSIHGRGILPTDGAKTSLGSNDWQAETQAAIAKVLG